MDTIEPSDEQLKIINSNKHTIVDAVAGSGKTTTAILIASKNKNKNIFQITYNSMLKIEVREKLEKFKINNMKIHTYHSIVTNFYDNSSFDDEHLKKIIKNNTPLKKKIDKIDILLIDEVQDMTLDYYKLVNKFIKDTESSPIIYLFGDEKQCIYQFKNASSQFLTLANKIWNIEFDKVNLSTSYRLTNQISWFLNKCMLKNNKIKTIRDGPKVDYYICNSFTIANKIGLTIRNLIKNENFKEDDFFILVPSIKSESPYKKLENYLVKFKIKCMTPISDDVKLDDSVIKDKVVFTTFHQSKGRERKVVIIYNFDNTYFSFFGKNLDQTICPNILYVALSRASYKLIIIQDDKNPPLTFLDLENKNIKTYVNILKINKKKQIQSKIISDNKFIKKSVSELVKFLSSSTLDILITIMHNLFENINNNINPVKIISKIETGPNIFEDVSELNGLVIPSIYEKKNNNDVSTIEYYVLTHIRDKPDIKKYVGEINIPCITIADYLKVGNIYNAIQNGLHSKISQIQNYNWLTQDNINECFKNINIIQNKNLLFEYKITNNDEDDENFFIYIHEIYGEIQISARIDAFDDENIYEFKCVNSLNLEHKLQLILYHWLWHKSELYNKYGKKNGILLNIRTGETLKLIYNNFVINQIVDLIIIDKFTNKNTLNDEEFLEFVKK
jgi:hypothetical protein